MDYANLISLGLTFLQAFLSSTKEKLPEEVLAAVQSTIASLTAHQKDVLTKANFEAQRG